MLHVTGYGGGGPKSDRPGYGTLAEAMSGFAHVTGQPDGPPTLPPFMLADGVASHGRDLGGDDGAVPPRRPRRHGPAHRRQPHRAARPADRIGARWRTTSSAVARAGSGNRLDASAPRNAYRTADDRWLAISSASPNIAMRVYRAIGRPELAEDPDYVDPVRRQERAARSTSSSPSGSRERTLDEAMEVFTQADVAAAPVYDAPQLLADEHLRARGTFVAVDDPDFGADDGAGARRAAERDARSGSTTSAARWAPTTTTCTRRCCLGVDERAALAADL